MANEVMFISKDANWQLYRNEVLSKLADEHNYHIEILTVGKLKDYLLETDHLKYKIFRNWFSQKSNPSFFPGATAYILKKRPYAVLALTNTSQFTEYFSFIVCKLLGIKFIWWTFGYDRVPVKNPFLRKLKESYMLFFIKRADAVITFADDGKDILISKKIDEQKIFSARNTLDTDKLLELKTQVSATFNKRQFIATKFPGCIHDNELILLFCGRLIKKKHPYAMIDLVKALRDRNINVKLFVVGDGEEKQGMINESANQALSKFIYFSGSVFDDRLFTEYFLASDLLIIPGSVGLSIINAFANDLPLITAERHAQSPEIHFLKQGINGFMLDEINIQQLADLIEKIHNDPVLLASLKTGAAETIKDDASIHRMVKIMSTAIEHAHASNR